MGAAEASKVEGATLLPHWAKPLLIAAAAIELASGLKDVPILFGDTSEIPGPGLDGWIIAAHIALTPALALAALVLLLKDHVRAAMIAMAALVLLTWLSYLPSALLHGVEFERDGVGGLATLFYIVLAPALATVVATLAWRGMRLEFATVLAVLPTVVAVVFFLMFAVGVAIYGF